jgi:hypothetical protein
MKTHVELFVRLELAHGTSEKEIEAVPFTKNLFSEV